jgi:HSP20 family molecular chaperone IbpA
LRVIAKEEDEMKTTNDLARRDPNHLPARAEQARATLTPAVDVYENGDELLLYADIPGVTRDDLALHFANNQLTIEARRKPNEQGKLLASEFGPADFLRSFSVPPGLDADKVSAEFRDGVLCIHLPKSAAVKPRQIQVREG